jgi:nucleoside phosphorylase
MPMIDYLILVPMDEELECARQVWKNIKPNDETIDQDVYYYRFLRQVGDSEALVVISSMGAMGLTWSGLFASQSIRTWKPASVILIGIAGSLVGDRLPLGDVFIPDQIVGYQIGDIVEQGTDLEYRFRRTGAQPSFSLMNAARALANDITDRNNWARRAEEASRDENDSHWRMRTPQLHVGDKQWLASGNFVVKSKKFADRMRDLDSQVRAVEMEAMGLFGAERPLSIQPAALVVRGISDFADGTKEDGDQTSRGKFRRAAMRSATQFVLDLIDRRQRGSNRDQASAERLAFSKIIPSSRTTSILEHGLCPRDTGSRCIAYDPLIRVADAMTEITSLCVSTPPEGLGSARVELRLRQVSGDWSRFLDCRDSDGSWTWKIERRTEPYCLSLVILTDDPHRNFKITAKDEFGRETAMETEPGP